MICPNLGSDKPLQFNGNMETQFKWSQIDKADNVDCSEGCVLKGFDGLIRTEEKISASSSFYYEITIEDGKENNDISFGITTKSTENGTFPSYSDGIVGYHALYRSNGRIYRGVDRLVEQTSKFGVGDTLGFLLKPIIIEGVLVHKCQFIRNGEESGYSWYLSFGDFYPTIAFGKEAGSDTVVKSNFGQDEFIWKGQNQVLFLFKII